MKEHERKGEAYIKSFNLGWRKNDEREKNYDRIFRKKPNDRAVFVDREGEVVFNEQ